ncbi:hypothetical protein HDV01_000827 [Terramyces sp. JEL0728]|nr:hypothetical protein HDV01_000819 [Terramyces sp. JEL0728]KAJ3269900.1 hypothetical protein HDV01_000827 [Terramyces sp. JEL0728]
MRFRLITIGTTALVGASAYYQDDLKKAARPVTFWGRMFPIFAHYRFVQWRQNQFSKKGDEQFTKKNDEEWAELHKHYAPIALKVILDLGGIYIKVGQVLATRPDVAPEVYRNVFKVLLDGVPGITGDTARKMVKEGLGTEISDVFSEFNDVPIAAASIAQVHKAKLLNGKDVVVKIQHPNAFELFKSDILTVSRFVRLAQPEQALIMDELEKQFFMEFDFEREAWALSTIHKNMKRVAPHVRVPLPVPGLVKPTIFVMDYIPGVKLIDAVVENVTKQAKRLGYTLEEFQEIAKHPSWMFKSRYLIDHTATKIYGGLCSIYNFVFGFMGKIEVESTKYNILKLYNELLYIQGHQILIDGIFNGDPHPGNILVTPQGNLGLIDYGQVKVISRKDRRDLAKLILLLAEGVSKKEETIAMAKELGFETIKGNDFVMYKTCVIGLDRDDLEITEGMGIQAYMEYLDSLDRTKTIPEQYVMAVRSCIILRGMSAILGPNHPPISICNEWKKLAIEAIKRFPPGPEDGILPN